MVLLFILVKPFLTPISCSDGYTVRALPAAQDHKRINDGDQGPNTGGMGCYAPAPVATPELMETIRCEILQKTIDGMRQERFVELECYVQACLTN